MLKKEITIMQGSIERLENQINLLSRKDPVANARIINKLKRAIRKISK